MKGISDKKSIELFGCTNADYYVQLKSNYRIDRKGMNRKVMKKQYTKKQITEAIAYWKKRLFLMEASGS